MRYQRFKPLKRPRNLHNEEAASQVGAATAQCCFITDVNANPRDCLRAFSKEQVGFLAPYHKARIHRNAQTQQ